MQRKPLAHPLAWIDDELAALERQQLRRRLGLAAGRRPPGS